MVHNHCQCSCVPAFRVKETYDNVYLMAAAGQAIGTREGRLGPAAEAGTEGFPVGRYGWIAVQAGQGLKDGLRSTSEGKNLRQSPI